VSPRRRAALIDLALMIGAFVAATLIAELAASPNLGTSMSFGQIAFALAALFVVLKR